MYIEERKRVLTTGKLVKYLCKRTLDYCTVDNINHIFKHITEHIKLSHSIVWLFRAHIFFKLYLPFTHYPINSRPLSILSRIVMRRKRKKLKLRWNGISYIGISTNHIKKCIHFRFKLYVRIRILMTSNWMRKNLAPNNKHQPNIGITLQ